MLLLPPRSTLFPYTTLFRSIVNGIFTLGLVVGLTVSDLTEGTIVANLSYDRVVHPLPVFLGEDRKSTRLNSSHRTISYAVFCLKKKNNIHQEDIVRVDHQQR